MKKNRKKFIAALVASITGGAMVVGSPVHAKMATEPFTDIQAGSLFTEALQSLTQQQIVVGYPDGTYRPFEVLTRGQAALLLARALQLNPPDTMDPGFHDVKQHSPYFHAIATLVQAGVVEGYPDKTFRPEQPLTRAQMAKILAKSYHLPTSDMKHLPFVDVQPTAWYASYLTSLLQTGITVGTTPTTYAPNQYVTRGQMALFLFRSHQYKERSNGFEINEKIMNITTDSIQLGNDEYLLTGEQQKWINENNLSVLHNAQLKAWVKGGNILSIDSITLVANSEAETTPLVLNGNGGLIAATVLVNGDNITLENVTIQKDLHILHGMKNKLSLKNVTVKGITYVPELTSRNSQQLPIVATHQNDFPSTNPRLDDFAFQQTALDLQAASLQKVEVRRSGFIVSISNQSSVDALHIFADSTIQTENGVVIPTVSIVSGHALLHSAIHTLFMNKETGSTVSLGPLASIHNLIVPVHTDFKSRILHYGMMKHKIINVNGKPNPDHQTTPIENNGGTPPSSDQTKLIAAQNAVAKLFADATKTALLDGVDQAHIEEARGKVLAVVNEGDKAALLNDVEKAQRFYDALLDAASKLQAAQYAVAKLFADATQTALADGVDQTHIEEARGKVLAVVNDGDKAALLNDVEKAQRFYDALLDAASKLQAAQYAVAKLFADATKTALADGVDQTQIEEARGKVLAVVNDDDKAALLDDVEKAQRFYDALLDAASKLQAAQYAVAKLFADATKTALADGVEQAQIEEARGKVLAVVDMDHQVALLIEISKAESLLHMRLEGPVLSEEMVQSNKIIFSFIDDPIWRLKITQIRQQALSTGEESFIDLSMVHRVESGKIAINFAMDAGLEPGNYYFTIEAEGYKNVTRSIEVLPLATPPSVTGNTSDASAFLFTFTEDAAWRENISGIYLNGNSMPIHSSRVHTLLPGQIKVDLPSLAVGTHTFLIKAPGYEDVTVTVEILPPSTPPSVTGTAPDPSIILFSFVDDAAWRENISGIYLNGNSMPIHPSRVHTLLPGQIKVDLPSLTVGTHTFLIKAPSYEDVTVTVEILPPTAPPSVTGTAPDPSIILFSFVDDAAWRENISGIYLNGNSMPIHSTRVNSLTSGQIKLDLEPLATGTHTFLIKAPGYEDVTVAVEVYPLLSAPALTGTAPNRSTVVFSFADDAVWRSQITGVYLNGRQPAIHPSRVTTTTPGEITINLVGSDLNQGTHTFNVKATGYSDVVGTITIPN